MNFERIEELAKQAQNMIETQLDCKLDVEFASYTVETGPEIARELRERIAPGRWEEKFGTKEYYASLGAEAVVGSEKNAILVRTDTDFDDYLMLHVLLHEFSHIFLIRNEYLNGEDFYDSFCRDSDDANVISGYSIWREYAAEVLARGLDPLYRYSSISKESKIVKAGLKNINSVGSVDEQRRIVTDMLTTVMTSASFYRAKDWDEFQQTCSRYLPMDIVGNIIKLVYDHMKRKGVPFWKINEDFIADLGYDYGFILIRRRLVGLKK